MYENVKCGSFLFEFCKHKELKQNAVSTLLW